MYRELVYTKELAQYAAGDVLTQVDNSQFYLWAAARPSVDIDSVESAMLEVVEHVKSNGVTPKELARAKAQAESESVGRLKSPWHRWLARLELDVSRRLATRADRAGPPTSRERSGYPTRRSKHYLSKGSDHRG